MNSGVILVTPAALDELVRNAIREELSKLGTVTTAPAPLPPYVTLKEFADYMHVCIRTVQLWRKAKLPVIGRGRAVRVRTLDALEWLKNNPSLQETAIEVSAQRVAASRRAAMKVLGQ